MLAQKLMPDANACFVCGPDNPIGLNVSFRIEGDVCCAEFTPGTDHQGYDGVIHGGILYSLLDDVMANFLFLNGIRAYTAKCEIRYKNPVFVGTPLQLEGRQVGRRGNFVNLEGKITRSEDDVVVAKAESAFFLVRN